MPLCVQRLNVCFESMDASSKILIHEDEKLGTIMSHVCPLTLIQVTLIPLQSKIPNSSRLLNSFLQWQVLNKLMVPKKRIGKWHSKPWNWKLWTMRLFLLNIRCVPKEWYFGLYRKNDNIRHVLSPLSNVWTKQFLKHMPDQTTPTVQLSKLWWSIPNKYFLPIRGDTFQRIKTVQTTPFSD